MKILVVNYECPPIGGGGGRIALKLAKQWARSHEVLYLTSSYTDLPFRSVKNNVHIIRAYNPFRVNQQYASLPSMFWFPLTGFFRGNFLCNFNNFDVINTHFVIPSGPVGWLLSRMYQIPNVLSLHGGDLFKPTKSYSPHKSNFLGSIIRSLLDRANAVVAQSQDTRKKAREFYGYRGAIDRIPLPFKKPDFSTEDKPQVQLDDNKFYLISIGRMIHRKGFNFLLRSMELLPEEVHLILIGNGPQKNELQDLSEELGISDRVLFTGFVSEDEKYRLLKEANCYVLSSIHEGFGIVLQEAMSVGLPIVATSAGGQVDLIEHQNNGLLIEAGSPTSISEAVSEIYGNDSMRGKMGRKNKEAIKEYEPSKIASEYLELFGKVSEEPT